MATKHSNNTTSLTETYMKIDNLIQNHHNELY